MKRIAPSESLRQELKEALKPGPRLSESDPAGEVVRLAARVVLQEALEAEQADFIGRDRYERGERNGSRNGYERGHLDSAEGRLEVQVPQVRAATEPFRSKLMEFLGGHTEVVSKLATEMYARGLSTRDIEEAFTDATGTCLLSKSAVSEVTETLWDEYEAFQKRDLSGYALEYLFVDAVYESLRMQAGAKEALLVAWGVLSDGSKVLLHMDLGSKESHGAWLDFFRSMRSRGLSDPVSVTSDGAPGLIRAIEEAFPKSLRIRCWFHKMKNVLDKLPQAAFEEVKARLRSVRDAPNLEEGREAARKALEKFGGLYPSAMRSFEEDLEASLSHLRLPADHRIHCRTTNLAERGFLEERRRTKTIPRFFDERSCLKLAFGTLLRAANRWRRITITDAQAAQLQRLRRELGQLDPPRDRSVSVAA
jgi:transposase-like protein